jgi:hypothetical protein
MRLRARDHSFQALSLVEKVEPAQVCSTLCSRDQRSMWMQDGCKVHLDSYMASKVSCFMVTWIIFKSHIFEVGLAKIGWPWHSKRSQPLIYSIFLCVRTPMNRHSLKIVFGWEQGHIWVHSRLEGPWPHYMILEVGWDGLCTNSFQLSQFHGHVSWLVCEVALSIV